MTEEKQYNHSAAREEKKRIIQDAVVGRSRQRRTVDRIFTIATIACVALAMIPLGSILVEVVRNGISPILPTVTEFATTLEGSQVGTSELSSAIGTGTFQYDSWTHELSYNIAFTDLSSPESDAHIYGPAVSGIEPRLLFTLPAGSPKIGSVDLDNLPGPAVTAEEELFAGLWYVGIDSNNYPDGELRGQIMSTGKSSTYLNLEFLIQPQGSILQGDGGIGPAIQGTLIVVGYASLIGVPIGVLTGIYLSEYAGNGRFARLVRFFNNVMTGMPSIVIGIVGYVVLVITLGPFNITAGAVALSIIMIPIVVGVTEETLKLVPNSIREAGHSLGIPKWRVTLFITMRSAMTGVLTGIVLAVSRIAGETAPLILTILGSNLFFQGLLSPVDAL
ncbi:MAG: phosphate ABC transporter permease PstA, partial [Nitrososphaera sp.]|nr:phosphate ABC transporter permease PstA [Nitrososphaera sp.]